MRQIFLIFLLKFTLAFGNIQKYQLNYCESYQPNIKNLHDGLYLFIRIFKQLVCIQKTNIAGSDKFYLLYTYQSQSKDKINNLMQQESSKIVKFPHYYQKIKKEKNNVVTNFKIFRSLTDGGVCQRKQIFKEIYQKPQNCQSFYQDLSQGCSTGSNWDANNYLNQKINNFDVEIRYYYKQTTVLTEMSKDNIPSPSYDQQTKSCQNVLVGAYYHFLKSKTLIDIIIQEKVQFQSDQNQMIKQQFSVDFMNDSVESIRVGNYGYITSSNLLFGYLVQNLDETNKVGIQLVQNENFISQYDSNGQCYIPQKTPVTYQQDILSKDAQTKLFSTNSGIQGKTYVINQQETGKKILNFKENALISCNKKLNYAQFKEYCNEQMYKENLYETLYNNFQLIGKYSNSNPNYIQDWIVVNQDGSKKTQQATFFDSQRSCTFKMPYLNIYFSNFGQIESFQYEIYEAKFQTQDVTWVFESFNDSYEQNFQYQIKINYVQLKNEIKEFVPSLPSLEIYLSNDVLYPFMS